MWKKKRTELKAEAFTVRASMENAVVEPPAKTDVFQEQAYRPTAFRKHYDRRDLPIALDYGGRPNSIKWQVDIERIDYHHYLPLFFEGLRETAYPYETLACQGAYDMLDHGGQKILPVIPLLVQPIREALNTRNHRVVCTMLKVLQRLVMSADGAGEALVPYYRNILPMFNILKDKRRSVVFAIPGRALKPSTVWDHLRKIRKRHSMISSEVWNWNSIPVYLRTDVD
ncbi:parkin coregulated gene protein isoform X1 [Oryzias latipes]|uniref:PARK2 co-regulated n=1 Tax=Oryzias latipes TaxID=8090 RepID=A0A3B3HTN3_ORYLA